MSDETVSSTETTTESAERAPAPKAAGKPGDPMPTSTGAAVAEALARAESELGPIEPDEAWVDDGETPAPKPKRKPRKARAKAPEPPADEPDAPGDPEPAPEPKAADAPDTADDEASSDESEKPQREKVPPWKRSEIEKAIFAEKKAKKEADSARAELERERQQLRQEQQDLLEWREKMTASRKAIEAGRYEDVLREQFGMDASEFNRRLLQERQSRDPRVDALESELRELRQEREQRERYEAERREQERLRAQETEWLGVIADDLSSTDYARHLEHLEPFSGEVLNAQRAHFEQTGEMLSAADAAQQVDLVLREAYERLHKVYGEQPAAMADDTPSVPDTDESKPRKRRPRTVSQQATDAPAPDGGSVQDIGAWQRRWAQRIASAS